MNTVAKLLTLGVLTLALLFVPGCDDTMTDNHRRARENMAQRQAAYMGATVRMCTHPKRTVDPSVCTLDTKEGCVYKLVCVWARRPCGIVGFSCPDTYHKKKAP